MDLTFSTRRRVPESFTSSGRPKFYDSSRTRNSRAYRNFQNDREYVEDCFCDCEECSKRVRRNEKSNKSRSKKKLCESLSSPMSKARIECVCQNQEAERDSSCSRYCRCPEQVFTKFTGSKDSLRKLTRSQKSTKGIPDEFRRRALILTSEQYRKFQERCQTLKNNIRVGCCTNDHCIFHNLHSSPRDTENLSDCNTETDPVCSFSSDVPSKYLTRGKSSEDEMRKLNNNVKYFFKDSTNSNNLYSDCPITTNRRQCNEYPKNVNDEYHGIRGNLWDLKNGFHRLKVSRAPKREMFKKISAGKEFISDEKFGYGKSLLPRDSVRKEPKVCSKNHTCSCSSSSIFNELKDPVRTLESFCEKVKAINRSEPIISALRSSRKYGTAGNLANFGNQRPFRVKRNLGRACPSKARKSSGHDRFNKYRCCSCCEKKYSGCSDSRDGPKTDSSGSIKFRSISKSQEFPRLDKLRVRPIKRMSKDMLIYPPDGQNGPPLTLFRDSSSVDCRIKGNPREGFRYDVTYIQNFLSPTWRPDEVNPSTNEFDGNYKKCTCWMDHG